MAYLSSSALSLLERANAYWKVLSCDGLEAHVTERDSRRSREGVERRSFSSTDCFAFRCVPLVFPIVMLSVYCSDWIGFMCVF